MSEMWYSDVFYIFIRMKETDFVECMRPYLMESISERDHQEMDEESG